MIKQQTFSDIEFNKRKRKTKREKFLENMDNLIPWSEWVSYIEPYYPKGERGRKPIGIEIMLRMYLIQIWFNLSDEMVEDSIYDSHAMYKFMGINFHENQVPDATTLLKLRHLIEKNNIGEILFEAIKRALERSGLIMRGGTIVDATIINASSSTKNKEHKRDEEMHSRKKGGQWYFGAKAHVGVDAGSGYVHTVTATSANVHDINEASKLVREDDNVVYGDSGYTGIEKREESKASEKKRKIKFIINKKPGKIRKLAKGSIGRILESEFEKNKSIVRSKVEHPFHIIKNIFGCKKIIYKGIGKNLNKFYMLFLSANLLMYGGVNNFVYSQKLVKI